MRAPYSLGAHAGGGPSGRRLRRAIVLVLGVLAISPSAALAAGPEYSVNGGLLKEGEQHIPVLYTGTLDLQDPQWNWPAVCNGVSMYGTIWNEHGRGVGEIEGFAGGSCVGELSYGTLTPEQLLSRSGRRWADVNGNEEEVFLPGHRTSFLPWRTELSSEWNAEEEAEVAYDTIGASKGGCTEGNAECLRVAALQGTFGGLPTPTYPPGATGQALREREEHRGEVLNENWWPWAGSPRATWLNGVQNGLSPSRIEFQHEPLYAIPAGSGPYLSGHLVVSGVNGVELIKAVFPWG